MRRLDIFRRSCSYLRQVPCYMVYRTDKQSEAGGFEFLFMSHVPDHSGVGFDPHSQECIRL